MAWVRVSHEVVVGGLTGDAELGGVCHLLKA